jgi:5-methylcytosine-specific restriction endonuclease McrA
MTAPHPPRRGRIGPYMRAARLHLWKAQRGRCYYCEEHCAYFGTKRPTAPMFPRNEATLDHIIPRAHGGELDPYQNCVIACRACNLERGTTDARLFALVKWRALPPAALAG